MNEHEFRRAIAAGIKTLRADAGWSQERLAQLAGTTQRTISWLECANRTSYSYTVWGICQAFGVSLDTLLTIGAEAQTA